MSKSLSLVLALIFVLGLCTIGSNAAAFKQYTDQDKVNYEEAVDVLSGLGVIEGYPDGSFNPTANVTRAEAAAMIARMMLGREKADRLPVGDVKFSDVPETNWAAKYIAFCANKGIIVGMGDGTFHPAENVTGTQMATMLLRALGYGVMGEYEGKGWDINAVADALYYKVFENSKDEEFSDPATREETALYCWNTMWIQLVGYDVDRNYYDGREYRVEYVDEDGHRYYRYEPLTFAKEGFNLVKWNYAQVIANQATGEDYTIVRLRTGYVPAKDEDGKEIKGEVVPEYDEIYLNAETGLDLIGHEVTLYFKDTQIEDKVNHLDYYDIFFLRDESTVYKPFDMSTFTMASYDDMYRYLKDANKDNLKVDMRYIPVWYNYDYTDVHTLGFVSDYDTSNPTTVYYRVEELKGQKSSMDMGWLFIGGTWILDHEGKILLVLKDNYLLGKVKAVDTAHDEVEVNVWNPYTLYYMPEYERYEEDDPSGNGYWKKGDLKLDPKTWMPITKKDAKGNDIMDDDYGYIRAYDWYFLEYMNGKWSILRDKNGNIVEALANLASYDWFGVKMSLFKSEDDSFSDTEVFDMKKGDMPLVYDGIAKNDYVVVQPQGKLTLLKETYTQTVDITERDSDIFGNWSFNTPKGAFASAAFTADSNYGIPVEDQNDPEEVGVGDEVMFYTIDNVTPTKYFALEILDKAKSNGIVYVNFADKVVEHGDWDKWYEKEYEKDGEDVVWDKTESSYAYKIQCVDQDGEEVVYRVKKEADYLKLKANHGVYQVFVRGKYATFEPYDKAVEITKQEGKNSYLKKDGNIYYVTGDTKVIYIHDEADDLDVTVSNKLQKGEYKVYALVKKTGGSFKLSTVWVPNNDVDAPDNYGDSFIYIESDSFLGMATGNAAPKGYEYVEFLDDEDPYYTIYIDGVETTHAHLIAADSCYDGESIKSGFYQFEYDEDGDYYVLGAVDAAKYVNTTTLVKAKSRTAGSMQKVLTALN